MPSTRVRHLPGAYHGRARTRPVTDAAHDDETCLREFARTRADAALEPLLRRHWPTAYRLAHACLHDAAAAEDVAQDVFLKLTRASTPELELSGPFAPWFRTLVLNAVRDRVKLADRRRRHEQRATERRPGTASGRLGAALEAEDLRREVARLPLDVRQAVVLRYFDGRTHEEVARLLDCPAGTASSRIRRGLEQLREQLLGAGYEVASVGALEALLLAAPAAPVPPAPATSSLRAARAGTAGKLGLAAALLAATVVASATVGLAALLASDPPPVAAAPPPTRGAADGAAPGAPVAPLGPFDGSAVPIGDPGGAAPAAPAPAPVPAPASSPSAPADDPAPARPDAPDAEPAPLRVTGRVLGAPAMTPLPDVELFLLRRELLDESPLWTGEPAPLGRTDAQGEFALASAGEPARPGHTRELTDVLLLVRRPGYRPFLRRLPRAALEGRLELVLEQAPAPRVRGRVVDVAGAPLPGLRVAVAFELAGQATGVLLGEAAPPDQAVTRTGHVTVEVTTDADGGFTAEGLLPGAASVSLVEGQSHSAPAREVQAAPDAPEVTVVAEASARLELEVLARGGAPCPRALFTLTRADDARALLALAPLPLDAQGRASRVVPAGRYRLAVGLPGAFSADERVRGVPDHVEVLDLAPGQARRVVVRPALVVALGAVTALVRDRTGAPVPDHEVWLVRADAPGGWFLALRRPTDAAGRAVFADLARGRYELQAQADLARPADAAVDLEGPAAEVMLLGVPRRTLRGVVRGPDGPIAGAEVIVTPLLGGSGTSARTDAEGRFTLERAPVDARVAVAAAGFAGLSRAFELTGEPIELVLTPARFLTVTGRAAPGVPDGTPVSVQLVHDAGMSTLGAEVRDGRFEVRFEALPSGAVGEVAVRVGTTSPATRPVVGEQESLDVGVLGAARGLTVQGRVEDPTGLLAGEYFVSVVARPAALDDRREFEGRLAPDGRLELNDLPAEPLVLTVTLSAADMGDDREATAEARFDPRTQPDLGVITLAPVEVATLNALRVSITDPEGALARAGLRDGDVIVGVNGVPFEDEDHAASQLMRVLEEESITCDVQRGTTRLSVRLDAAALDAELGGGDLEPCRR